MKIDVRKESDLSIGYGLTDQEIEDFARAHGLRIVEPGPNELQLDIDSPTIPETFYQNVEILRQIFPNLTWKTTKSRHGNLHIHVSLGDGKWIIDDLERLALQAMLGSDRKREILNYKSWARAMKRVQFLYEVEE